MLLSFFKIESRGLTSLVREITDQKWCRFVSDGACNA